MTINKIETESPGEYATASAPMSDDEVISRAIRILDERMKSRPNHNGKEMTSPAATRDFLRLNLADRPHEVFCVLFLDTRHRLIAFEELFFGTIDSAHVHPRVVVERTLQLGAAALILAHNHPSGVAEPSQADLAITRRLRDALGLIDVRLLDHIVIGDTGIVSMAERGLI